MNPTKRRAARAKKRTASRGLSTRDRRKLLARTAGAKDEPAFIPSPMARRLLEIHQMASASTRNPRKVLKQIAELAIKGR